MAFDPDKYLAKQKTSSGFDPDAYLNKTLAEADLKSVGLDTKKDPGQLGAAAFKGREGLLMGGAPFVAGVGGGIGAGLGTLMTGRKIPLSQKLTEAIEAAKGGFEEGRKDYRKESADISSLYPTTSTVSEIGGALATAPLTPIRGLAGAAKLGAGTGLLRGLSEGENVGDVIESGAKGIGLGVGSYGVAKGIGKLVGGTAKTVAEAPEKLKKTSDVLALKSAGAMKKDMLTAVKKGRVEELGNFIKSKGLVRAGDDIDDVFEKVSTQREKLGKEIGTIYEDVVDQLSDPYVLKKHGAEKIAALKSEQFNPFGDVENLKSMVANAFAGKPGGRTAIGRLHKDLDDMALNYLDDQSIKTSQEIIHNWDKTINYPKLDQDSALYQQGAKLIRDFVRKKTNNFISKVDDILGNDASKRLLQANKDYRNAAELFNIAQDRVARESANRAISLTDTIGAGAGAGAGAAISGGPGAVAGLLLGGTANRMARKYGPGVAMGLTQKASEALPKTGIPQAARGLMNLSDLTQRYVPPGLLTSTFLKAR